MLFSTFPYTLLQQLISIMKVVIQAGILQKKLTLLSKALSSKAQLPILSTILIETYEGKIQLSSTDLEIGIQTHLIGTIDKEGAVAVPARSFIELINSLPDDSITLQTTSSGLDVSSKRTKSVFQTMSAAEYPKLFEEKGEKVATLTTQDIKNDFSSVIFSSGTDATRMQLTGVLLEKEKDGFLLVATDGYRLSLKRSKIADSSTQELRIIVPSRVFRELIALREEAADAKMYLAKDKNQILFELSETVLIGRLIEGEFPTYEKIIPTDHSASVLMDREEVLKAVKICSIFARESANIIKFSLRDSKVIVSSSTPSLGENTVDVEAKLTGEENEIAFNARYLNEVLSILSDEEVVFEMTGPLNPGVFKIKNDPSFLHLIMPIRLQQ